MTDYTEEADRIVSLVLSNYLTGDREPVKAELRAIARAAVNDCATAIEDKRHEWEEAAQVAGDRRDWDGTDNYEAMAEAAARLEGIIRSRAAKGGEK